jgi:hypothetical protein
VRCPRLAVGGRGGPGLAAGGGGVAGAGDRGGQLLEAHLRGVEPDGGDLGGRFTSAPVTPSTRFSAFSTRPTQEAHVIPPMSRAQLAVASVAGAAVGVVVVIAVSWKDGLGSGYG